MRRLLIMLGVALIAASIVGCGGEEAAAPDDGGEQQPAASDEPIVFGIAAAKTGFLATFDTDAARAFLLRIDEINAEGGILGRQVKVEWIDSKTDLTVGANAARELIDSKKAEVILATCDVDYGSPQALEAQKSGVVAFSFCAGGLTWADKKTLGPLVFTFGQAGDDYGTRDAEWAYEQGWRRTYVLNDESLDYNKHVERYFRARWEELGGEIVGTDTWVGVDNPDLGPQVSRLRQHADDIDFIYVSSFGTIEGQALRQIRAAGIDVPVYGSGIDGGVGVAFTEVTGDIEDYTTGTWACYIDCTGDEDNQAELDLFLEKYQAEYDTLPPTGGHAVIGWDLAGFLKAAIEEAGTTEGEALVETIESMEPYPAVTGSVQFSDVCHKPQGRDLALVTYSGTEAKLVTRTAAQQIPDIGDGNPCR